VPNSVEFSRLSTSDLWLLFETAPFDVEVAWAPVNSLQHTHTHRPSIDVITFPSLSLTSCVVLNGDSSVICPPVTVSGGVLGHVGSFLNAGIRTTRYIWFIRQGNWWRQMAAASSLPAAVAELSAGCVWFRLVANCTHPSADTQSIPHFYSSSPPSSRLSTNLSTSSPKYCSILRSSVDPSARPGWHWCPADNRLNWKDMYKAGTGAWHPVSFLPSHHVYGHQQPLHIFNYIFFIFLIIFYILYYYFIVFYTFFVPCVRINNNNNNNNKRSK